MDPNEIDIPPTPDLPEGKKKQGKQKTNAKLAKKKTVLIRKKPSLNVMAQAMRLFFVKHLRKQLNDGRLQTKYLKKFEVSNFAGTNGTTDIRYNFTKMFRLYLKAETRHVTRR